MGERWRGLGGAGREGEGGGAGMRIGGTQGGDEACSGGLAGTTHNGPGAEGSDSGRGDGDGDGPGSGSSGGGDGGGGGGDNQISGRRSCGVEAPTAEQGRPPASAAPPPAPVPAAPPATAPGPTAAIRQGQLGQAAAAGPPPPQGRGGLPNGGAGGSGELVEVKVGGCRVPKFLKKRWTVSNLAEGATEEKTVYGRMSDGSMMPYNVLLCSGGRLSGLTELLRAFGAGANHMLWMTWEVVQEAADGAAGGQFGVVVEDAGPAAAAATGEGPAGEGPAGAAAGTAAAGAGGVGAAVAAATSPKAGGGAHWQRQARGGGEPQPDLAAGAGDAEPRRAVEQDAGQLQREQQSAAEPRWVVWFSCWYTCTGSIGQTRSGGDIAAVRVGSCSIALEARPPISPPTQPCPADIVSF